VCGVVSSSSATTTRRKTRRRRRTRRPSKKKSPWWRETPPIRTGRGAYESARLQARMTVIAVMRDSRMAGTRAAICTAHVTYVSHIRHSWRARARSMACDTFGAHGAHISYDTTVRVSFSLFTGGRLSHTVSGLSLTAKRHFARDHNHQPQTIIDPFVDEVVTFVTTMSKQLYKCAHPCGWYHILIPTHTQHPHTHRFLLPEPPPSIFGSGCTPGGLSASRTNGLLLLYPNAQTSH